MNYTLIIPAYNEEKFIGLTLESLVKQTVLPTRIVVVNDNSTDNTEAIITSYTKKYNFISLLNSTSTSKHLPGSKVIMAFNKGLACIDHNYDFIVKADADLIFPPNYFEVISKHFQSNNSIGMAGGFCYIEKKGKWVLENLTDADHIRGAIKAYRKDAFNQIGGLKPAMGWDTVDELLCRFYNWKIKTDKTLHVKHLKPTGANYSKESRYKQGEAFYTLGYGFWITAIASIKLTTRKRKPILLLDYLKGFWQAKRNKKPLLVTKEQARFIRKFRWEKIKNKVLGNRN